MSKLKIAYKIIGFLFWSAICTSIVMIVPEVMAKRWLEVIIEFGTLILVGIGFWYLYYYKLINHLFDKNEGELKE